MDPEVRLFDWEAVGWILLVCGLLIWTGEVAKRHARRAQANVRAGVLAVERDVQQLRDELKDLRSERQGEP